MKKLLRSKYLVMAGAVVVILLGFPQSSVALEVGQKAPDFKLPSTTGKRIGLSDYVGKKIVLVEFYGADFSPI